LNHIYAHNSADYTLKELAQLFAEYFTDCTATRFEGKEFRAYFSNMALEKILQLIEDFRVAVANKIPTLKSIIFLALLAQV
jgi:GGDEF domain-containing protein